MAAPRTVIVHHHIFKCAGTSLDTILERSFPGRLIAAEPRTRAAGEDWIAATDGVAYTSHHVPLGLSVPGVVIIPAVFIREPLARIVSAYGFERRQGQAGLDRPGARLAATASLADWLRARLGNPADAQVRNLQSVRLATLINPAWPRAEYAMDAVDALPFVGLVEAFEPSLDALSRAIDPYGLALAAGGAHANAAGVGANAAAELARLPAPLLAELVAANSADIALHRAVAARYGVTAKNPLPALAS